MAPGGIPSNLLTLMNGLTAAKQPLSLGALESRQWVLAMRANPPPPLSRHLSQLT